MNKLIDQNKTTMFHISLWHTPAKLPQRQVSDINKIEVVRYYGCLFSCQYGGQYTVYPIRYAYSFVVRFFIWGACFFLSEAMRFWNLYSYLLRYKETNLKDKLDVYQITAKRDKD